MLFELCEPHFAAHGNAVIDYMQIRLAEIDYALPLGVFNVCVANIPFLGHGPIKHLRAARNLMQMQWNVLLQNAERLPNAVTSDAAANRIKLLHQANHGGA